MNVIKEVVMGADVRVATPSGLVRGKIRAADASAKVCGLRVFMVGVQTADGPMLWRERSEVYQ